MIYDIVIVGCGTAGMTAAVYACRSGMRVLILEGMGIGGQIAAAPKIENFPAAGVIDGLTFSDKLFSQVQSFGAEVRFESVTSISKSDVLFDITTDSAVYSSYAVVIASGMRHRTLGIEGEDELIGCGISYCAVCDGGFYEGRPVAVVGGGNSALQETIYLAGICSEVHLIHRRNEFRADISLVNEINETKNIIVHTPYTVDSLNSSDGALASIDLRSCAEDKIESLDIDALFVAVGEIPQTDTFVSPAELDDKGFIVAGEDCKTNVEGLFAAGDCRTKQIRQLTTAASDGAVSALNASDYVRTRK